MFLLYVPDMCIILQRSGDARRRGRQEVRENDNARERASESGSVRKREKAGERV